MASETTAAAREAQRALDAALKSTEYSCKLVSWDDVSRSHANGSLSSIGPNITDTYLRTANGASLYTVRSDNWNEKLGMVSASDITLLNGNCDGLKDGSLSQITLDKFLANPFRNGGQYAGLTGDLSKPALDTKVSIRFQTVFLPLGDDGNGIQFASEAYNYQTSSDDDPRNIILLATSQGLSVQAGAKGKKRLLLHHGTPGDVKAYWMKAEASRHKVGAEQKDTVEERATALARGSATSERLGTKAMGERFNALMTIQVPLLQKKPAATPDFALFSAASMPMGGGGDILEALGAFNAPMMACAAPPPPAMKSAKPRRKCLAVKSARGCPVGTASAARVSRGDFVKNVRPLPLDGDAVRHPDEHVTVTVVFYHAVKDGVPSADDARAAVDELDRMFVACDTSGKLADKKFNPVKFGAVEEKNTPPPSKYSDSDMEIVMKKISEFATAQNEEQFTEMQLITLGAVEGVARKTIAKKLDAIKSQLDQVNKVELSTIAELKLLVKGALSS